MKWFVYIAELGVRDNIFYPLRQLIMRQCDYELRLSQHAEMQKIIRHRSRIVESYFRNNI